MGEANSPLAPITGSARSAPHMGCLPALFLGVMKVVLMMMIEPVQVIQFIVHGEIFPSRLLFLFLVFSSLSRL